MKHISLKYLTIEIEKHKHNKLITIYLKNILLATEDLV